MLIAQRIVSCLAAVVAGVMFIGCSGGDGEAVPGGADACPPPACMPGSPTDAGPSLIDGSPDATVFFDAAPSEDCSSTPPVVSDEDPDDGVDNDCDGYLDELEVCASSFGFPSIAGAIQAASPGDTVEVCAGTYVESLSLDMPLRLVARDGADMTFVDGDDSGRVIDVSNVSAGEVHVEGFTLQSGFSSGRGGAVRCRDSGLVLRDSVIRSSRANEGGGLFADGCIVAISDTSFIDNEASERGGAMLALGGSGSIVGSNFNSNEAKRGGALYDAGEISIVEAIFANNDSGLQGGALYLRSDALVADSDFENNDAGWTGGGIFVFEGSPTFEGIDVIDNTSVNDGGGIYLHRSGATISNSRFEDNVSGDDGGGVRIFEGGVLFEANRVEGNHADDSGGGIRVSHMPSQLLDNEIVNNTAIGVGGGMDLDNCSSLVRGGIISGNTSSGVGGGIHAWLFPWFGGTIEDVVIANNTAWQGGGIYLQHNFQHVTLRGLTVEGNEASVGAGIAVRTTDFTLTHSTFRDNDASGSGGALSVGMDGGEYDEDCPCPPTTTSGEIRFVSLANNAATSGGAGLWVGEVASLLVDSSIFAAHTGTTVTVGEDAPTWTYNDVFPADFDGMADPTGTGGNMSVSPQFVNVSAGNFDLEPASACVDRGNPAYTDMDGTRADMGSTGGIGGTL